jgi:hypothetical protein
MICKKAHNQCYEEVMGELIDNHKLKVKTGLSRLEYETGKLLYALCRINSEKYDLCSIISVLEEDDLLTSSVIDLCSHFLFNIDLLIDKKFLKTHFQCCMDCNCCEHHITNKPRYLKSKPKTRPQFYSSHLKEMATDSCKCSCQFFSELFLDINTRRDRV